jgi:rhodanese-related sulfurtransferase
LAARVDTLLGSHGYRLVARLSTRDGASWPVEGDVLVLGARRLRRIALGSASLCYVLDSADGTPSHAFAGGAEPAMLVAVLPPETLLCPGFEEQSACCTSLRVALAGQNASATADMHLDGQALDALLRAHPDALLVDVREAYEHAAGGVAGLPAVSVPLSRFAAHLPAWLGRNDSAPLVFFCRSGNRSARAAECLRRHGYRQAYHLAGGVALAA